MMNLDLTPILAALTFAAFISLALERLYEATVASWLKPFASWLIETYIAPHVPGANPPKVAAWFTLLGSVLAGILLAYSFGIDLLSPLAVAAGLSQNFYAGFLLTGLAIGGGAGLFHMIFGRYEQRKVYIQTENEVSPEWQEAQRRAYVAANPELWQPALPIISNQAGP